MPDSAAGGGPGCVTLKPAALALRAQHANLPGNRMLRAKTGRSASLVQTFGLRAGNHLVDENRL